MDMVILGQVREGARSGYGFVNDLSGDYVTAWTESAAAR
jgi:hypothetical protein